MCLSLGVLRKANGAGCLLTPKVPLSCQNMPVAFVPGPLEHDFVGVDERAARCLEIQT
jgi:hypothetical protein